MDPETLGPLLETHQLKLASGWFSGTLRSCSVEEEWQNLQAMLHTFKSLGAPVLVYAETSEVFNPRKKFQFHKDR